MEKETKKAWEKPWTTDEIRAQSANWNLAGDAGLLNHLQEFSQNLLSRTHATEVALDKLMEDMKTTSINVQNVTNKFLSLANTQFVENRVYDDDEKETPVEEKKKDLKNTKTKEEKEIEAFENVKQALQMGMSFLDTYFETVEVSASDSEEEESSMNMSRLILKPRNPYISRPLPYLIGSQEFMEDENVGLGDVQSDTEENPDQNIVHSSDSEEDIAPDNLIVSSKLQISSSSDLENSEPESDRSESMVKQRRTKQSSSVGIVGQQVDEERDMFGQESPPEADVMSGGMRTSFSDELASKLGANKTPVSPQNNDNLFGPSSETEDDGLFGKSSQPYSEKRGLFDDINNWQNTTDSLWNNKSSSKDGTDSDSRKQLKKDALFGPDDTEDGNNGIFTPSHSVGDKLNNKSPHEVTASTPKDETGVRNRKDSVNHSIVEDLLNKKIKDTTSSLFDKDDTEDDLFATPAVTSTSRQSSADLDSTKRKKLPGAVRVIDDVNLFGNISPVIQPGSSVVDRSSLTERSIPQQEVSSGIGRTIAQKEVENESLEQVENGNEKSLTFDSSLFQATSTKVDSEVMSKSLFNEEHQSDSLFDKPRNHDLLRPNLAGNVSGPKLFPSLKSKAKKSVSIFEDSDSGDDELLFSSTSSTSSRSRRSQGSGDLLNPIHGGEKTLFKKGLFDDCFLDTESKEEPDVDIFKPFTETTSQAESLKKKSIEEKKDIFDASSKIGSSIFDDIDDDEDDIFAVPKSKDESFVYKNNFLHDKSLLFSDAHTDVNSRHILSNPSLVNSGASSVSNDFVEEKTRENVDHVKPSENLSPKLNDTLNKPHVLEKDIETKAVENDSQEKSELSPNVQSSDMIADCSKVETSSVEVRKANNPVLNVKAEPPRSLNIRKTTNITAIGSSNDDEDDDLFENSNTHKSPPERVPSNNVITKSSSFGKLLEGFRSSSENNSPEIAETLGEKRNRIPDHLSNSLDAANIPVKVPSPASSSRSPSTSPKKLFIDPRALLPGAKPPPIIINSDTGVGFDKPAVTSSILHSAGKERVKIQAKRRPPTRKARKEALKAAYDDGNSLDSSISPHIALENNVVGDQLPSSIVNNSHQNKIVSSPSVAEKDLKDNQVDVNSAINFLYEETSEPSQATGISDDYRNISDGVSGSSNPMSPLTDEEDLFAVPQEFPGDEVNSKEIISSPKNLFGGAPVLSPLNDLLQSDREDSSASPFENVCQVDDFLSGEFDSNKKSATKDVEEKSVIHSLGSSHTSGKSETILGNKPIENALLFQVPTRRKMFGEDLESEGGLFEKVSGHKNMNENYDDDDSLFSTVKKNESRRGSEQEKSMKTKMKSDQGGIFSSLDSPTKSLFSSVSEPSKNNEPSKPSSSREEGNFSDPIQKLPLANDTVNDYFLKQGGSILQVQGDDDLFSQGGKVKITGDSSSSASLEKTKSHISSLFGDDSTDTDDLFSSSSITAGKKHIASSNSSMLSDSKIKSATESLFDDCDDDDIFAIGPSKRQGNSASLFPEVNRPDHKETDQSLLPKKNASTKPQVSKPAVQKMTPKADSFEDPLMVIKK